MGIRLLVVSVLAISLLATPVLPTWIYLVQSYLSLFSHFDRTLAVVLEPGAGQEVLPDEVQQMLALMRAHHIGNYRLSPQLSEDTLIYQRTIEASWPVRMQLDSAYLFSRLAESVSDPDCAQIDQRRNVVLDYCGQRP
jgi:hypothetical protein